MRLWIDGQCLQTFSRLRGIGRYVTELIRAIAETAPDVELAISFNAAMGESALAAREAVEGWIAPAHIHVWQGAAARPEASTGYDGAQRLGALALAHHVACLAPDIALSASPFEGQQDLAAPLLTRAGHDFALAGIFYDAIPYRHAARYLGQAGVAAAYGRRLEAQRKFDLLLAISGFARQEAEALLPGVTVAQIDAGVSPDFIALAEKAADRTVLTRHGLENPFLLNVGALDWRKNVAGVVAAFAHLPDSLRARLQLVLAGDLERSSLARISAAWTEAGLPPGNFRPIGHVDDETLAQLYKQADLVIQPSLMEGFGLTALEAMHCGAPVIAADAGALPEVVGDARALFDPARPQNIAARIAEFMSDPSLARDLVAQGRKRAEAYSWQRTARLAVAALQAHSRPPRALSREALRRITLEHWDGPPRPAARAAEILAAAEPRRPAPGRLLVDVTFTTLIDVGTGIQRVVNNIAPLLARGERRDLFWCNSLDGFFQAGIGAGGKLERRPADAAHHLIPAPGDHILMLDSTWIYPDFYRQVMRRARLQGCPITTVIYDLVPLKMPGFCEPAMPGAFAYWLQTALEYSTGFVCISQTVADELLALLQGLRFPHARKIGFWRLGADLRPGGVAGDSAGEPVPAGQAPDFLMVSTLEPRKGYKVALDAFSRLWAEGFDGHLTIIGKRGWEMEHFVAALQAHPQWNAKLHWLEGAGDATLQARYAACTALINTSYGEGFGMPVLEAAFHGKPVIVSDLPVFREIAQGLADVHYFTPGSAEALARAVQALCARGAAPPPAPVALTTWTESAAGLEKVVLGEEWYRHYQPALAMPAAGDDETPRYALELVEGPIPTNDAGGKFILRLTNLGHATWSGAAGMALGYRLRDKRGQVMRLKTPLSPIPLVQLAGDSHYMAMTVRRRAAACAVEFALFAGGEGLWDQGVRVELSPAEKS